MRAAGSTEPDKASSEMRKARLPGRAFAVITHAPF
jgi:hypothetical protein